MTYLPTKLTKGLEGFLAGISQISDPIHISPQLLIKTDVPRTYSGFRGKIESDQRPVLILQSMPISSLVFFALEVLVYILRKVITSRQPNLKLVDILKEKKPWYKLESLYKIAENQRYMFIESRLIDIAFNATLNLTYFWQTSNFSVSSILSFLVAVLMFLRLVYQYTSLIQKVFLTGDRLLDQLEKEICHDNILDKVATSHPSHSGAINLAMKLNFFSIPILLILMQNSKNGVCVALGLI